jgi:hypothetical protein
MIAQKFGRTYPGGFSARTSYSTPAVTRATSGTLCSGIPGVVWSGDRVPHGPQRIAARAVLAQEVTCSVGAVDLKAVVLAAMPLDPMSWNIAPM